MSFHRFNASNPLVAKVTTSHKRSFGIAAAVLCPVMAKGSELSVDYDRAKSARNQLQAMLTAVARADGCTVPDPNQTATTDPHEPRRLAN
jgi:type II secretory pathway pseudopilin PulG